MQDFDLLIRANSKELNKLRICFIVSFCAHIILLSYGYISSLLNVHLDLNLKDGKEALVLVDVCSRVQRVEKNENIQREKIRLKEDVVPFVAKQRSKEMQESIKLVLARDARARSSLKNKLIMKNATPKKRLRIKKQESRKGVVTSNSILQAPSIATNATLRQRGIKKKAKINSDVMPHYPEICRKNGEEGIVVCKVSVSHDGRAGKIIIYKSCGISALDNSAKEFLQQAIYEPAINFYNQYIDSERIFKIVFKLDG